MLVEQIDNAANLEALNLWPSLISLLSSPIPLLCRQAASVIGTAVHNNPKSQQHFLHHKGLPKLVAALDDSAQSIRLKVIYALSGELAHNPPAVAEFNKLGGWNEFRKLISVDEDIIRCERRIAFFIANYLAEEDAVTKELEELGFLRGFADVLADEMRESNVPDVMEKVSGLLMLGGLTQDDTSCSNDARKGYQDG
jgi:hypothetical protein